MCRVAEKLKWSKAWLSTWRDAASARLDMCSTLLRQWMSQNASPGEDGDTTGWVVDEDGDPVPLEVMARECYATLEQIEAALARLVKAKVAIERDGRWGIRGWRETQESPEAARVRRHRAKTVTASGDVTPTVTPAPGQPVTSPARGGEERREKTELLPPPVAGVRAEISPPATDAPRPAPRPAPPATIGQRLALARELVGFGPREVATRARVARARYAQLEADEALPTRSELEAIAVAVGDPTVGAWPLPKRSTELVEAVVRQHRDLGIELGALDPDARREPLVVTAGEVDAVYQPESADIAAGLDLATAWARVLARAGEELRRDVARGKFDQRRWFTLRNLAAPRRREQLLAAVDLDRRDDGPPARASPRRSRGPAPPQNPDRLTTGDIPS